MHKTLITLGVVVFAQTGLFAQNAPPPPVPYDGGNPSVAPTQTPAPAPAVAMQATPTACDQCQMCNDPNCPRCRGGRHGLGCPSGHLDCTTCCIGTCDMYLHYAYRPEYFGYYYFRPYNYVNIFEQKAEAMRIGGDPIYPYSLKLFDPIYTQFAATARPLPPLEGSIRPLGSKLPMLEDLLDSQQVPPEPPAPGT